MYALKNDLPAPDPRWGHRHLCGPSPKKNSCCHTHTFCSNFIRFMDLLWPFQAVVRNYSRSVLGSGFPRLASITGRRFFLLRQEGPSSGPSSSRCNSSQLPSSAENEHFPPRVVPAQVSGLALIGPGRGHMPILDQPLGLGEQNVPICP